MGATTTNTNNSQPLRIGLTGGIASGKSTVADLFAELGVPIVDTDVIAREVVQPGQTALAEIVTRFGDDVVDRQGQLKRRVLRETIFANESARRDLEGILHPRIGAETKRQAAAAGGIYQIIVVPLLVGSDLLRMIDRVLVVDCDEDTQVARLLQRDAETEEQARRILATQASRSERLAIADDVIHNDRSRRNTRRQVRDFDRKYRAICESQRGGAE